ncbi:MAG: branched-chain amino acid transporter AzlD [Acidimicrobiia bacterium]|nr:MAG: branched-chain amino acid transporter AzlD [Acidimicrobiia bacterium]
MTWAAVLLASVGCYLCKLAGLSVPARVVAAPRVQRVAALLPVALLGALIATQTFTDGRELVIDARAAGLAAAAVAVWRRAPFLAVVGAAAATTALLRALA